MLDRLERKFGRYAIPNLTAFLVGGQALAFLLILAQPGAYRLMVMHAGRVMQGEVWRVVTFLIVPETMSPIFIIFALYLLWLYGRSLEAYWGAFKFNVFILVGWVASIGAAFLVPSMPVTNAVFLSSILFAFAYLNPDFELLLFFILPVKIKWIALIGAAFLLYSAYAGGWSVGVMVLAGVLNFILFFGRDIWVRLRGGVRRTAKRQQAKVEARTPNHTCEVCGITDLEDPTMQFRYCSKCHGSHAYCMDHLRDHEHVRG